MSSMRVASELASVLVPIGVTGAVLAVLCAIVAAVAIVRGAGGLSGGAVGVWIPSAMLTLAAGFANQWTPLLVSGVALVALLIAGGVTRGVLNAIGAGRPDAAVAPAVAHDAAQAAPVAAPAPAAPVAAPAPAPVRPAVGAALTGTVSTLARANSARAA